MFLALEDREIENWLTPFSVEKNSADSRPIALSRIYQIIATLSLLIHERLPSLALRSVTAIRFVSLRETTLAGSADWIFPV
ncbi:hypothetical protein CEXT_60341 [Caerostris extrusa]|uniref:Maturase K n=1 Tax=Caerostris extrusa TaxID=172846 RepID=A0AAV4XP49_CAEEX|nr:hypothetical protein CEXT_60341 [Caerostris extrusa]